MASRETELIYLEGVTIVLLLTLKKIVTAGFGYTKVATFFLKEFNFTTTRQNLIEQTLQDLQNTNANFSAKTWTRGDPIRPPSTRNWISTVTHISGDGTFAASPSIFVQHDQNSRVTTTSFFSGIPEDRARNVRERRARYPPVEWNLFQRTLDQHSRSNNFNESNNKKTDENSWHSTSSFVGLMLRVKTAYLSDYDNDFNDWVHGRGHRHRKRQAINRDTRIRNQVHRYQQFLAGRLTAEEYLNGIVVALRG
uniref:Uncharacterized protein n=1 Tax=Ditylenchus dipsaci TaxID=166011 RepID=A0A915EF40_9BILA